MSMGVRALLAGLGCTLVGACVPDQAGYYPGSYTAGSPGYAAPSYGYAPGPEYGAPGYAVSPGPGYGYAPVIVPGATVGIVVGRDRDRYYRERLDRDRFERERYQRERFARPPPFAGRPGPPPGFPQPGPPHAPQVVGGPPQGSRPGPPPGRPPREGEQRRQHQPGER